MPEIPARWLTDGEQPVIVEVYGDGEGAVFIDLDHVGVLQLDTKHALALALSVIRALERD